MGWLATLDSALLAVPYDLTVFRHRRLYPKYLAEFRAPPLFYVYILRPRTCSLAFDNLVRASASYRVLEVSDRLTTLHRALVQGSRVIDQYVRP